MIITYKLPTDLPVNKVPELMTVLTKHEGINSGYDEETHSLLISMRDDMPPDLIFLLGSMVATKEMILTPLFQS